MQVSAVFAEEEVSIAGETRVFNGLEVNGVGTSTETRSATTFARRAAQQCSGSFEVFRQWRWQWEVSPTPSFLHLQLNCTRSIVITGSRRSTVQISSRSSGPGKRSLS